MKEISHFVIGKSLRDLINTLKCHTMAMTKWIVSKNLDSGESVIDLVDSHHKDSIKANRQYMKIIIESLVFTAQQNIAQRGPALPF